MNIAITVITYNRLRSLQRLIQSLKNADYRGNTVDLIISVDRSNCEELYAYVDRLSWPHGKLIREYKPENMGLRAHILSCGTYFEKYGQDALVILEDDLFVARDFFQYVLETTAKYKDNMQVAGISLYAMGRYLHKDIPFVPLRGRHDAYFMQYAQSWGQVWMKDQWGEFAQWYREHTDYCFDTDRLPYNVTKWPKTSWLRYHIAYCVETNKYFVYPYESLSTNFADAGVHYKSDTNKMQVRLLCGSRSDYRLPDLEDEEALFYDVFGENEKLYEVLGLEKDTLCVDICGLKANPSQKRYWLTTQTLPYKAERSFGLVLKPHDYNILENVPGDVIRLYDTQSPAEKASVKGKKAGQVFWDYYYECPNVAKYNVPKIYCTQMWQKVSMAIKAKLKKRGKK